MIHENPFPGTVRPGKHGDGVPVFEHLPTDAGA